jgi:hypothetical protein
MAGGEPPHTPADVKPGPERELLKCWYQAAVDQDPSLGPRKVRWGRARWRPKVVQRLLRSRTFARVAQRASSGT